MASHSRYEQQSIVDVSQADETTSLLHTTSNVSRTQNYTTSDTVDPKWTDEVSLDEDSTTWQKESFIVAQSAAPMIITFLLQYSLTVASVFTIGPLGKTELGGISLGMMSANISGYLIFQGLATGLDTLCAQAYGSGKRQLVGLHIQRMLVLFAFVICPVAVVWLNSTAILELVVPDKQVAHLASRYLKVLTIGLPGYASFECGKRFLQAQGLFTAPTYVVVVCAPLNGFLNWFFVWKLDWGYDGAAIAVVITDTLLPTGLVLYVIFVNGRECWCPFSKKVFSNWGPMIHLGLPGLIALLAEYCAFELLTLASSHISTTALAAQSIQLTILGTLYQIPYSLSVAGSTRLGNLIGATYHRAAKTSLRVIMVAAAIVGLVDMALLWTLRYQIPRLLNSEVDVIAAVAHTMPLCACFQLFDAVTANCNGILRGIGRQRIIGYLQVFAYYFIGLPISMTAAFKLHWDLIGLWMGIATALALLTLAELIYIRTIDLKRCVEMATERNESG